LQDLTPRAQAILDKVDLIVAEDTRHSRHLLNHFGITTSLHSLHEHNERQITEKILVRVKNGTNIAIISDAGTPLISDPGYYFLQQAHVENITIVPIPGASAIISALSVSGFPANSFLFEGFLPAKTTARKQSLENLVNESRTLVFYEAPHRIIDSITDMEHIFGERQAVLAKELTKQFETIYRDNFIGLLNWLQAKVERQKGEFVIVVAGASPINNKILTPETERVFNILRQELPLKKAAKLTSEITGVSKNAIYNFGIS
jgi:16S rRNA (cytidine1402-2'-O)-methyltransferase